MNGSINSSLAHITYTTNDNSAASSSCEGTSALFHITGSNTVIFCYFEDATYVYVPNTVL